MPANRNVKQWFAKSADNLRLAKSILNLEEKFYEHVCFNAQQSAEKAIKGFLTYHKVRFDKTHDIAILAALVRGIDKDLSDKLVSADELTEYAVRIRYPEETGERLVIDKKLASKAIEIAEMVLQSSEACSGKLISESLCVLDQYLFYKQGSSNRLN